MRFLFFVLFFIGSYFLKAQSNKISGKVINAATGQSLGSATLILLEKSKTVIADQNGNFIFSKLEDGTYTIKCSYTGYNEKIIEEIILKKNDNAIINISLEQKKSLDEIVITSRVRAAKESIASILIAQKNSASVSDGISAEAIRKTPDRNTSDVLKRVSGASIQDDRFAIIRGLNDRYNSAFINGAPLPSTESDRKAFAFDIFPASILDNLIIYKTATPDKTGEFGGGIIEITTKSIPSKNFTSISFSAGYNSITTGKQRSYSDAKGSTDWIGIDDGARGLPAGLPSRRDFTQFNFAQKAELAKLFKNYKWGVSEGNTVPDFNFQFSSGFNIERKQKEFLGGVFSVNYKQSYSLTTGGRDSYSFDNRSPVEGPLDYTGKYQDSIFNKEVVVALLGNFSIKLNNNNSISWKNNLSINTDNKLGKRSGYPDFTSDSTLFISEKVRWFTSNKILSSQLAGDHQIGMWKTKINWLASFSKINRDIPNLARTNYFGASYPIFVSPPALFTGNGNMFFSTLGENIKSIKTDITQPYKLFGNNQQILKIGVGYQLRKRVVMSRTVGFSPYNENGVAFDYSLFDLPENKIFTEGNLGLLPSGKGGFKLNDGTEANADYTASSALTHVYLMTDQRLFKKLRLIYGARLEKFNQQLNSVRGFQDTVNLSTEITDILPSANIVYALSSKMNFRLSYSKTLNRPEFRELAPYVFYDFITQFTVEGSEKLQRALITNYDFRYELFPGKAQLFSLSAFYKDFQNPIEFKRDKTNSGQLLYVNVLSAKNFGVEAEFRTLLSTLFASKTNGVLSKLTLAANASYIKSTVRVPDEFFENPANYRERALQGQSPYVLNSSLTYEDEKLGLSSTISLNRVGDRIFIVGTEIAPNIYEKARTVVDLQIAKLFLKNKLEIKFNVRDMLAQPLHFYFDADQNKKFSSWDKYFSSTVMPSVYTLTATYKW